MMSNYEQMDCTKTVVGTASIVPISWILREHASGTNDKPANTLRWVLMAKHGAQVELQRKVGRRRMQSGWVATNRGIS